MTSNSKFRPHGKYKASIEGRILVAHKSGNWNIEMQQESERQSRELVSTLEPGGPWGTIVTIHDTLLTSLEVLDAGRKTVADMPAQSNLVALAWVIDPKVEGYTLLLPRVKALYEGLMTSKVFDNYSAALYWIEGEIASKVSAHEAERGKK